MTHMNMQTANNTDENFEKLKSLFPNAVTETITGYDEKGNAIVERAIDKDVLMQEINTRVVEGKEERYQFTWPDKKKSVLLANAPTTATLRPCKEESVDFDNTENLYIEGDNLEVLKLLQETYLGKIKMIYIDPPYNTGNDFVYEDDFTADSEEYKSVSGDYDAQGNRLVKNLDSNGRFHTNWLNMIYPRLRLAKDLLTDDGVIFISIDDNEVENLRKVCDEVFGEVNFISPLIWSLPRGINAGLIARAHEYILCYARNINEIQNFNRTSDKIEYSIERCNKKIDARHPESEIVFPAGVPYEGPDKEIQGTIDGAERITINGIMKFKNGKLMEPVTVSAGWTMKNMIQDWLVGKEVFDLKGQKIDGFYFKENGRLYSKKIMTTVSQKSLLKDIPDTQDARKEIEDLFGNQDIFSYPKPYHLPKLFAKLSTEKDSIILDFFSGSATTAHAVMQLNAEDGGNRKFIMVQLPEETDEKSEAFKAGYKNICEIGKERIRRAGKKILEEQKSENKDETLFNGDKQEFKLDIGFRVLKLDSSNMQDVYYAPENFSSQDLFKDNIKGDRTAEDLLFQVILDLGIELSVKIETKEIDGKKVFYVDGNSLVACFDNDVTEETITKIAKEKPYYFVMKDASMANDNVATNFEQIFATFSPETERRVL